MKNKILLGLLVTVCILGVGLFVSAQNESSDIDGINEFAKLVGGDKELIMKLFDTISGQLFGSAPSEIATGFYDVYIENDLSIDGDFVSSGGFTSTATTTPSVNTYFSINPTMTHTATSTIVGTSTQWLVMGYYLNTGDDIIVDDVYMEETVAPALFQFDVRVGTTTCKTAGTACGTDGISFWTNTSTNTLTASTTVTTTWTTDINGFIDTNTYAGTFYNPISNEGRPTTTQFVLKHGEAILWSWLATKATSTASYTADGGFNAVANAGARARLR